MSYLNFNGALLRSDKAIITADNRGFRYGDGLFETMKISNGTIQLASLHFDRLFHGIQLLEFDKPAYLTPEYLSTQIHALVKKNGHRQQVRVRLVIFRGNGGLYDPQNHFPNYIIQSWDLPAAPAALNENGLVVDIYPKARIACDSFSSLKTNNYLPYLMAALFAKKEQLNECLLLNANGNVCDATIANVFILKNEQLITPPLTEGCVAGVMRRYLLEKLPLNGFTVMEQPLSVTDIENAEEIFLSNAIRGIRWVGQFKSSQYQHSMAEKIFSNIIRNIL